MTSASSRRDDSVHGLHFVAAKLQPLVSSLEKGNSLQQAVLVPELLQLLPCLASGWTSRDNSPAEQLRTEAVCISLLAGLRRLQRAALLSSSNRQQLSTACKNLVVSLIDEAYPEDPKQQSSPLSKRIPAYTLLKVISRGEASVFPLLVADSLHVYEHASKLVMSLSKDSSCYAGGMKAGSAPRADHTLPLLVGLMGTAAHSVFMTYSPQEPKNDHEARRLESAPIQETSLAHRSEAEVAVLASSARWACVLLRAGVQRLMGGPPSSSGAPEEKPRAGPSASMIRAAAHLALNSSLALLVAVAPPTMAMKQQVGEVLEVLLDLSEAVVVSSFSVLSAEMPAPDQHATVRQVFETGASILKGAPFLMDAIVKMEYGEAGGGPSSTANGSPAPIMPPTSSLSTILSRLKGMLFAASALASGPSGSTATHTTNGTASTAAPQMSTESVGAGVGGAAGAGKSELRSGLSSANVDTLWDWDLQRPLTAAVDMPSPAGADGAVYGWAAQQFVRVVAESMCAAMAAAWHQAKQRALVQALLLLPGSGVASPNERKAIALVTGRLLVLLKGDEKLSQACLPLLMDAVTMQPLAATVKADAEASKQEATMFACFTRTIAAMSVAAACKHVHTYDWAYEQITDLLIRLYRDNNSTERNESGGSDVRGACLALAITRMVEGMAAGRAPYAVQIDLQIRLLSLFSDLGMRVRTGGLGVVRSMGDLLPAVAAASQGVADADAAAAVEAKQQQQQQQQQQQGQQQNGSLRQPPSQCGLNVPGSSRFNYDGFAKAHKEDGARIKLMRNLWLHLAVHHLAAPTAPASWRKAAGLIAKHTPLLLVGLDSGSPEDVAERLKVELGPRLARAGTAADPAALRNAMLDTYGVASESPSLMMPAEPAKRAHLLLVATCELSRVALAPVPAPGECSPLATTLAYLELSRPGSVDSAWFELLARRAFERLLLNVAATREAAASGEAQTGPSSCVSGEGGKVDACQAVGVAGASGASKAGLADCDVESRCAACIEGLAVTLIEHLGNVGGHESGSPPQVAVASEALLQKLLTMYPPTHWNPHCMLALLGMLEAEEGDRPMGLLKPKASKGPTIVWKVLQGWVYAAALVAPTRTEAILHQFLGQTAPGVPLTASTSATDSSALASAAALRRAADLLSTIASARLKSGTAQSGRGTSDSVLAQCRKQYYSGVVLGLQHTQLDDEGYIGAAAIKRTPFATAAQKVLKALEAAVSDAYTPQSVVEERYMTATALLATSSCSKEDTSHDSIEHTEAASALLRSLVSAPLGRFSAEMMPLALFAWMWVTAASPKCIIPMTTLAADAWVETARRGLGLFSGARSGPRGEHTPADGNDSAAEPSVVVGLQCHGLWLNFFNEMWDSVGDGAAATTQQAAMREVIMRMLHSSLASLDALSSHPAAAGPRFCLLNLALRLARSSAALSAAVGKQQEASKKRGADAPVPTGWLLGSLLLRDRAIQAGLAWFTHPPAFSAHLTHRESQEQHATVSAFANALSHLTGNGWLQEAPRMKPRAAEELVASLEGRSVPGTAVDESEDKAPLVHPVWGSSQVTTKEAVNLLHLLCKFEMDRLQVWTSPLSCAQAQPASYLPQLREWELHARTAWRISPRLAVEMAGRFPTVPTLQKEVERLLVAGAAEKEVQLLPKAALMLATPEAAAAKSPALQYLAAWAPGKAVEGLQLISSPAGRNPLVKAYATRCLANTPPAEVAFYLPQLVQSLRNDSDGSMGQALLQKAQDSDMFAHQLIWALQTEEKPPQEAFNPEVKRSGWEAPRDFGLWGPSTELLQKVLASMSRAGRDYWEAENTYFEKVTSISGVLKKIEKDERKAAIAVELAKFEPSRSDLYLPTNPDCRVINHIHTSGTPMQSAAKVPILIAFKLEQLPHLVTPNPDPHTQERGIPKSLACIFKVGDDVRQDVLALQVIRLLELAFKASGLPAYLCSYGCLPTGYERGIIEVVPNTKGSRAGLGELSDKGLYDIFQTEFGMPGSPAFEAARHNFIASEAGYAIASFLLQAKDRHNGNLLITNDGHLVHIDFGFILEISPGGNMGFESAAFKLSHEMTQLLDPGANRSSATWAEFEELVVRGYLAARTVAEPIIATVALMAQSGLPCYSRGAPVENLRRRFHLEMSEKQAAAFMRQVINDAYAKWTTGFYDYIQSLQNRIPY